MLYNFSEYTPPASTLTPADMEAVRTAITQYTTKRRLLPSMSMSKGSKKAKGDNGGGQSSSSTNFRHSIINTLLDLGYDVEMPPQL